VEISCKCYTPYRQVGNKLTFSSFLVNCLNPCETVGLWISCLSNKISNCGKSTSTVVLAFRLAISFSRDFSFPLVGFGEGSPLAGAYALHQLLGVEYSPDLPPSTT